MERSTSWKLWLTCFLALLAASIVMLAGQTAIIDNAFKTGVEFRHAGDVQGFLLKTEVPASIALALIVSAAQILLILSLLKPGGGATRNSIDASNESKNLYDQVLAMYRAAITDEQTGAIIYKHFKTMLETEFARSQRYKMAFSLVKISIENKENFNSVFSKVAFSITNVLRNVDITSVDQERKFVILLPNTKKTSAETAVRRVWARVHSVEEQVGTQIRLAAGISTFRDDGDTIDVLLEALDRNLEKARMLGANTIIF